MVEQGRTRESVAFCSNIVVTIDGPGKYFIEIVQPLTRQTTSVRWRDSKERESRIDAGDLYLRRDFNRSRQRDDIVREESG